MRAVLKTTRVHRISLRTNLTGSFADKAPKQIGNNRVLPEAKRYQKPID